MAIQDLKYDDHNVLVGQDSLEIVKTVTLNLERVFVEVLSFNWDMKSYLVRIVDSDFSFHIRQELLEDEKLFVSEEKYKQYKTYGDTILLKTPHNQLREYSIEEIHSTSEYENFITLKLKSCD